MAQADIEKAFLAAAEIAKKLPENLQQAGFARALDQLLGADTHPKPRRERAPTHLAGGGTTAAAGTGRADRLIDQIDRTACPDIGATARVADRALKVLQLAHQNHEVDGLTAGEIAEILSRKFRLPVKVNSVTKALEREGATVDIRGGPGAARMFHIMAPGEEYLKQLRSKESGLAIQPGPKSAFARRRVAGQTSVGKKASERASAATAAKGALRSAASSRGRPGPKAALAQLMAAGFFDAARVITAVQAELKHRRGHTYSVQELAPALVRSIRDGSLVRTRNDSGRYEYAKA